MIKCSTCNALKEPEEYYFHKGKLNGKKCKACRSLANKQKYQNKKFTHQIKEHAAKKRCKKCGELKSSCEYDRNILTNDTRTSHCKDCINQKRRERYSHKTPSQKKELYTNNKAYYTKYRRERMKRDPYFKLRARFSTMIHQNLKRGTGCNCFEHLPYSLDQLVEHLEEQFVDGMNWSNYGSWHIDHIYPQSKLPYKSYDDVNFKKAWKLSNLRPLWASDNIKKGNRILFTEHPQEEGI